MDGESRRLELSQENSAAIPRRAQPDAVASARTCSLTCSPQQYSKDLDSLNLRAPLAILHCCGQECPRAGTGWCLGGRLRWTNCRILFELAFGLGRRRCLHIRRLGSKRGHFLRRDFDSGISEGIVHESKNIGDVIVRKRELGHAVVEP
jgi:hypothetical protein